MFRRIDLHDSLRFKPILALDQSEILRPISSTIGIYINAKDTLLGIFLEYVGRSRKHTFQDPLDHWFRRLFESVGGIVGVVATCETAPAARVGTSTANVDYIVVFVGAEYEGRLEHRGGILDFEFMPAFAAV
jgi:hypothetical protein